MRYFLEIEIRYSIINLNQTKLKEKKNTHRFLINICFDGEKKQFYLFIDFSMENQND
jgi:hypothetical protein